MMTEATELTQLLIDSQSSVHTVRRTAEQKLLAAEETSFAEYLKALAHELSSENRPSVVRQLAGIVLKNAISGTEPLTDAKKREKWVQLPQDVLASIRSLVLSVLQSPCEEARSAACQVIAKVARLDLACNKWPELLPFLMQLILNRETPSPYKRAGVTAVGYLCDDISTLSQELAVELLQNDQKNTLMTIVTHCVCDADEDVALAGCNAFYHALLFARDNMVNPTERDFIFQIIGKCLNHTNLRIQHAAWECALQIATEYYQFLTKYAGDLGNHSIETIKRYIALVRDVNVKEEEKKAVETVALAALEFWNSICDVEIMLAIDEIEDGEENQEHMPQHFIRQAKVVLLPVLFEAMTTQGAYSEHESELEEWTLAMAAGTCVTLCAQVLQDDILESALEFVNANFADRDWKRREAAVLAYGSVMEGPSSQRLEPLVQQSFQHLCKALNDDSIAVRDSTAWTIGRIAAFHTRCVLPLLGTPDQPGLMNLLLEKLGDVPRVASFVCFAIHEIARNMKTCLNSTASLTTSESQTTETPLDPFLSQVASALLQAAQKPDAMEGNLRQSAFEALSEVVEAVAPTPACLNVIEVVMKELIVWLEHSFTLPMCEEICQVQGLICGCLNNITDRLGSERLNREPQVIDTLFQLYTRVIDTAFAVSPNDGSQPVVTETRSNSDGFSHSEERSKGGSEEDAILAIGTLVRVSGTGFERHLLVLSQILVKGLQNPNEVRFCRVCIGVICEIAVVFNLKSPNIQQILTQLLPVLFNLLHMNNAPVSLKPSLITTIGDIAVGMEKAFEPYLDPFLALLNHAACTRISDGPTSEEWVEYLQELRNSVLEAFSSIIHGLREAQLLSILKPHVSNWLSFITLVIEDPFSSTANITRATEVTGDLVTSYRSELVSHLVQMPFYHKMIEKGFNAQNEELKHRTVFLQNAVVRCGGKTF